MEKLNMSSPDFTEQNIAKLTELFPNCVTELKDENGNLKRAVDFDLLKQDLSADIVDGPQERYRLDWPGKRDALINANTPIVKTLRPYREESVDFDTTENLFIEGDNLDALKLLQETYLGKVRMIYIDPPYNTGKDFIYKDKFTVSTEEYHLESGQRDEEGNRLIANPESSGRFHSDWLSMMYPRLKLARNLLRDDGVIFISIDDNEVHNLRKLCDEIFGRENFIASMVLLTGSNQSGDGVKIQTNTETCLVYSKYSEFVAINRVDKVDESLRSLSDAPTPLEARPYMGYSIYYNPQSGDFFPVDDYDREKIHLNEENKVYSDRRDLISKGYTPIRPGIRNLKLHAWRWGYDTFKERKNEIEIKKSNGNYAVFFKQSGFNAPKNVLRFGSGTTEVKDLFDGVRLFDFPKGTNYIQHLASIGSSDNDLILDFFAGSATTAHAVMQLNAQDGGQRKFIMVQLPEKCDEKSEAFKAGYKNIAEVSKERIRRAGEKIKQENALAMPNLDTGFRVLKVDTANMADIRHDPDTIEQGELSNFTENIKQDRTSEDLLFQVLLNWGVDLTLPITKETVKSLEVFFVDKNALAACFAQDGQITNEIGENLCKELATRKPLRVVFRDSGFADDSVKINVEQVFKLLSPRTDVKTI